MCFSAGIYPQICKPRSNFSVQDRGYKLQAHIILPVISKALEKYLHSQLTSCTDKQNTFSHAQLGFRKQKPTEQVLLAQNKLLLHEIEDEKFVLGVFIDFSKAFDSIDPKLLLKKLEFYGIRGREFEVIESYIGKHQQYVTIHN